MTKHQRRIFIGLLLVTWPWLGVGLLGLAPSMVLDWAPGLVEQIDHNFAEEKLHSPVRNFTYVIFLIIGFGLLFREDKNAEPSPPESVVVSRLGRMPVSPRGLASDWSAPNGFFRCVARGEFDPDRAKIILRKYAAISMAGQSQLDPEKVRMIWSIPLFLEQQKHQFAGNNAYMRFCNEMTGLIDQLLGLPAAEAGR